MDENFVMKTKKPMSKANLWATIVMCVLGVLAIVTIVMAIVPKSYAVEMPKVNPNFIYIYQDSASHKAVLYEDADKDLYDELLDAFNGSFSQSALSALFQKELGNAVEYSYLGSKTLTNIASSNDFVLGFVYSDVQTLYKDGKPYVEDKLTSNNYPNGVVTFKKLWITVNQVDGVGQVNFYVQRMVSEGSSESSSAVLEISTKGIQNELVDVINKVITEKE